MGVAKSGTTEQLHFHFSVSCIGEVENFKQLPGKLDVAGQVYRNQDMQVLARLSKTFSHYLALILQVMGSCWSDWRKIKPAPD